LGERQSPLEGVVKEKKILLIGETGFLGHKVATLLAAKTDYQVTSLLNSANPKIMYKTFRYKKLQAFIQNPSNTKFDVVLNLATKYLRPNNDIAKIIETNLVMPLSVLDCLSKHSKTIFITGDTFYSKFPVKLENCVYTKSKAYLGDTVKNSYPNIQTINARIEHMYGELDAVDKFIPKILRKLKRNEEIQLTNCLHKRDFVYVDDVASAIVKLLEKSPLEIGNSNVVEIGTGRSTSLREMIEKAQYIMNSKSQLKFGALNTEPDLIKDSCAEFSPLLEGWEPKTTLKQGLLKCIL
jgi:nucleoside-diphosphate-sugar epimerase